jgi:hypothetical protein
VRSTSLAEMAFLTRSDARRNIDRFYFVDVTPTLFGEWAKTVVGIIRGGPNSHRRDRGSHPPGVAEACGPTVDQS